MRDAYQEVYDADAGMCDHYAPTSLPKVGVENLEGILPGLHAAGVSLSDVIAGWKVFVRDKYAQSPTWGTGVIKLPVAFFVADEVGCYIEQAKREAAQEVERARTVQPPREKSAAEIASELLETNAV